MTLTRSGLRLVVGLLLCSAVLNAQQMQIPVQRLQSSVDTVRVRAFYELLAAAGRAEPLANAGRGTTSLLAAHAARQNDLALALIELLERENARVKRAATEPLPENFLEGYHADLFVTVARMRDPRAVKVLMPVIANGDVVQTGVADLGIAAVPELVNVVERGDDVSQFGALRTLGKIAARADELRIPASAMTSIRKALLRGATDPDNFLARYAAVSALIVFSDEEIRPVMENIAANDPWGRDLRGERVYSIREMATEWLRTHPRR